METNKNLAVVYRRDEEVVTRSNELVRASCGLERNEWRLLEVLLSGVDSRKFCNVSKMTIEELNGMKLELSLEIYIEVLRKYGVKIDTRDAWEEMERGFNRIFSTPVIFRNGEDYTKIPWFVELEINKTSKTCSVVFSSKIIEHISKLTRQFCLAKLETLLKIKGTHTVRLYELLLAADYTQDRKKIRSFRIDLSDLTFTLGIQNKYCNYADLKRRAILSSIEELRRKNILDINLIELKNGRKVETLVFEYKILDRNNFRKGLVVNLEDMEGSFYPSVAEFCIVVRKFIPGTLEHNWEEKCKPFLEYELQEEGVFVNRVVSI